MNFRHELKFGIHSNDIPILKQQLESIMERDINQGENGYTISSLYFDTLYNRFYDENDAGIAYRDKIRVRCYNHDYQKLKLEIKSKDDNLCIKRSTDISNSQYNQLLNLPYSCISNHGNNILTEVTLINNINLIHPIVIVEYDRYALTYPVGNVRITFDTNIRANVSVNEFANSSLCVPILDINHHILEVKYDDILPGYIKSILDKFNLNQIAFSKYYMCRNFLKV